MALVVGALLAFTVGLMATAVGLDRDRAFYPTVTIVIASYYARHGSIHAGSRARVAGGRSVPCNGCIGFKSSLWVVVGARRPMAFGFRPTGSYQPGVHSGGPRSRLRPDGRLPGVVAEDRSHSCNLTSEEGRA